MSLRKKSKSQVFKPKEKNGPSHVKSCLSHVKVVSKVFDLLYGQRHATWRIIHVSDACPVCFRVSTCPTHEHSTRLPYSCLRVCHNSVLTYCQSITYVTQLMSASIFLQLLVTYRTRRLLKCQVWARLLAHYMFFMQPVF